MTRDQYITFQNTGQGAEHLYEHYSNKTDLSIPFPVFMTALQQAIHMGRVDFRKLEIELKINLITKDGNTIKYY